MKVSRKWIDFAHIPPAESGIKSSVRLCELADAPGRGSITVTDPALLAELLDVAELYGPNSATDDMGPWWKGEQRRVVREARRELRWIANREAIDAAGNEAIDEAGGLARWLMKNRGAA